MDIYVEVEFPDATWEYTFIDPDHAAGYLRGLIDTDVNVQVDISDTHTEMTVWDGPVTAKLLEMLSPTEERP